MSAPNGFVPIGPGQCELGFFNGSPVVRFPGTDVFVPVQTGINVSHPFAGNGADVPLKFAADTLAVQASDANTLSVTGLNGDSDGDYDIFGFISTDAAGAQDILVKPNGLSANQRTTQVFSSAALGMLVSERSSLSIFFGTGAYSAYFFARLTAKTGTSRIWKAESYINGPVEGASVNVGHWDDTTTNITSLVFAAGVNILAGSWVNVRSSGRHS